MDGKEIGGCCSRDSALGMDGEDGRRRNGGREGEVECGIHLQAEDSRDLGRRRTWEGVYTLMTTRGGVARSFFGVSAAKEQTIEAASLCDGITLCYDWQKVNGAAPDQWPPSTTSQPTNSRRQKVNIGRLRAQRRRNLLRRRRAPRPAETHKAVDVAAAKAHIMVSVCPSIWTASQRTRRVGWTYSSDDIIDLPLSQLSENYLD